MDFSFTLDQLTPETIATVLNGAYIKTEAVRYNEGEENEYTVAKVTHDGWVFQLYTGSHSELIFKSYQTFSSDYGEEKLKQIADYMDAFPVDSTYICEFDDSSHVMSFHYQHILPEDETLSPAYLVKLCRHFTKTLDEQRVNWSLIEQSAMAS